MRTRNIIFASIGAAGFLIASVLVALSARSHQLSGQQIPNGKGGFMDFRSGYHLAVVLFLISMVWLMSARRYSRSRSS
jgi:hypothetical protein